MMPADFHEVLHVCCMHQWSMTPAVAAFVQVNTLETSAKLRHADGRDVPLIRISMCES